MSSYCNYSLTSKEVRQNQQNTCLQRLHIICAQPASRSIGTLHIGHLFMSPSMDPAPGNAKTSPNGPTTLALDADALFDKIWLLFVLLLFVADANKAFPFCAHVKPGCQLAEQREQNSLSHEGHFTGRGSTFR